MKNVTVANYTDLKARKFVYQMLQNGFQVQHYNGRNFYQGPTVVVDSGERDSVARACDCQLQSDNMGYNIILYPTFKADFVEDGQPVTDEEISEWSDKDGFEGSEAELSEARKLLNLWMYNSDPNDADYDEVRASTKKFLSK